MKKPVILTNCVADKRLTSDLETASWVINTKILE